MIGPFLTLGEIIFMSSKVLEEHVEKLLKQRYYHLGENWAKLVNRVISHVCSDEHEEYTERIRYLLFDRVFLPNSPCLVNSGKRNSGLFACFVAGPSKDDLNEHLQTLTDISQVAKAGGGCGLTGTFIRQEGASVAGSAHGYAYGPCNWIIQVNNYLTMITQGGFRNMALMATMRSDHPDLEKFIDLKQSGDEAKGAFFNQSIMATDTWLNEAVSDPDSLAGRLLRKIAENAWNNGEPGLLFYDQINNNTPYKTCGCTIEATNPCGEQPLPEYGSCNLASINLNHNMFYDIDGRFRLKTLEFVVKDVAQFLDNVGSKNAFPNENFKNWYEDHRPIGLGVMGYADMLLRLGIPYGSDEALLLLERVMESIYNAAKEKSEALGILRGIPKHCKKLGRRNITLTTIAPTGSISFIANCSSSIEPIYAPSFTRTDERGQIYNFNVPGATEAYFRSAINPDNSKVVTWEEHVNTQIAAQKYIDSGTSKTINFPETTLPEEIYNAFIYAWEKGAKGITAYRNNSRQKQVLSTGSNTKRIHEKRPDVLLCDIHRVKVAGIPWLLLIGLINDRPYELFAIKSPPDIEVKDTGTIIKLAPKKYRLKINGTVLDDITKYNTDEEQALTRLISLLLRSGVPIEFIVGQLEKSEVRLVSFSKAVNRVLSKYSKAIVLRCPECGSKDMIMQSACSTCNNCGYSKCG